MTSVIDSLAALAGVNSDTYTPVLASTLNDETSVVCDGQILCTTEFLSYCRKMWSHNCPV